MSTAKDPFIEVAAGAAIFREGDSGSEMYIIESGSVDIVRAARGEEPLATLEAGDFFGEMSILEDQPRFASAMARTPCRLLRIDRAAFGDVVAQNVEIAIRIMRKLVSRLRRSDQRAAEAVAALDAFREKLASRAAPAAASVPASAPASPTPPPPPASAAPALPDAILDLRHNASGQTFALGGKDEFLVGRPDPVTGINPEVNLGPYDSNRTLSRRHAKIMRKDEHWWLREDVGTTNGTFVNGERLKTGEPVMLKVKDILRFGSVEVEVIG
jgi:hypothetical protein